MKRSSPSLPGPHRTRTPTSAELRGLLASGGRGDAGLSDAMTELEALDKLYDDTAWKVPEETFGSIGDELEYIYQFRKDRILKTKQLVKEWRDQVHESKKNAMVTEDQDGHLKKLERIENTKKEIIKNILKQRSEQEKLKDVKGEVLKEISELNAKRKRWDEQVKSRLPTLQARLKMMMVILGLYIFPKDENEKATNVVKGFIGCTGTSDCIPFEYNKNDELDVDIADDLWSKLEAA